MATENKLQYQANYKKKNIKKVSIEFNLNNPTDVVLHDWLKDQPNKTELIKTLLYVKMANDVK